MGALNYIGLLLAILSLFAVVYIVVNIKGGIKWYMHFIPYLLSALSTYTASNGGFDFYYFLIVSACLLIIHIVAILSKRFNWEI